MARVLQCPKKEDFKVAIICAMPKEADAMIEVLGDGLGKTNIEHGRNSSYAYSWGIIEYTPVVLVMPNKTGNVHAGRAAEALHFDFPNLDVVLLVGICGGVPTTTDGTAVYLGDVIISEAVRTYLENDHFVSGQRVFSGSKVHHLKGHTDFVQNVQGQMKLRRKKEGLLKDARLAFEKLDYNLYVRPALTEDLLFPDTYQHMHRNSTCCNVPENKPCKDVKQEPCKKVCIDGEPMRRRSVEDFSIHYGYYASDSTIMRDGPTRDQLAKDGVLGFDTEATGVTALDIIGSFVIKGVCDYADCHKNDTWQQHAAATAACVAKAVIQNHFSQSNPGGNGM